MLPNRQNLVCSIIKLATIAFDETSSYWSAPESSLFLGFSLVATRLSDFGQHFVTTMVVHLPNRAELITSYCSYARSAQPGPNRTRLCGPCIAAKAGICSPQDRNLTRVNIETSTSNFALLSCLLYSADSRGPNLTSYVSHVKKNTKTKCFI